MNLCVVVRVAPDKPQFGCGEGNPVPAPLSGSSSSGLKGEQVFKGRGEEPTKEKETKKVWEQELGQRERLISYPSFLITKLLWEIDTQHLLYFTAGIKGGERKQKREGGNFHPKRQNQQFYLCSL